MTTADDLAGAFEALRPYLRRVAYGTLGTLAEADDVVQKAWLRLQRADADEILDRAALLLDRRAPRDRALGAARRRREQYVGPWLPEPLVEDRAEDRQPRTLDERDHGAARRARAALTRRTHIVPPPRRLRAAGQEVAERRPHPSAVRQLASRARGHVEEDAPLPRLHEEQARIVDHAASLLADR